MFLHPLLMSRPFAGPTNSIDFESGSNQYLSMSDANFGAYSRTQFAVSVWVKREATGNNFTICGHYGANGNRAWRIFFTASDKITVQVLESGSSVAGLLTTTATYTSPTGWYHILVWFDLANATAGDRMRMWVNGTEVTAFDSDTNPTTAGVYDSTANVTVGADLGNAGSPQQYFDGLLYQFGLFSGSLPAIGDVYNGGRPKDIAGLSGLYAYLDVAGGSVVSDGVLAADWTNNNTAVASSTTP